MFSLLQLANAIKQRASSNITISTAEIVRAYLPVIRTDEEIALVSLIEMVVQQNPQNAGRWADFTISKLQ